MALRLMDLLMFVFIVDCFFLSIFNLKENITELIAFTIIVTSKNIKKALLIFLAKRRVQE